jgi:4-amino-4-deoxychorismate lyase
MNDSLGTWIDGQPIGSVPADDRGLHYGDGVFETMLVRGGSVRFLEAHLTRLTLGCSRLGIRFTTMPELRAEIAAAAAIAPPLAVLKLIVTRGSAVQRGYAPAGTESARRMLSLWPASRSPAASADGVHLILATLAAAENPALAGIKHLNRLENVLAAAETAAAGAFDALMLDSSQRLISGAMSNVFLGRDGRVLTPRIDRCGVAGVMRGVVLRECAALGIGIEETLIPRQELLTADEVFITNARIGVVPVGRVGEHRYPMNTIARRLRIRIEALDA